MKKDFMVFAAVLVGLMAIGAAEYFGGKSNKQAWVEACVASENPRNWCQSMANAGLRPKLKGE